MESFLIIYIGTLILMLQCYAETELLKNPDFESTSFSGNWHARDCTLTPYTADKYHGSRCIKVSNRHHDWSSAQQDVSLTGGQWYSAKSYIKLLNMPAGVPYVFVEMMAIVHVNGHRTYETVGQIRMQQEKFGWTEVGGDFFAPNGSTGASLFIKIHNSTVNYLQDFSSLQRIPSNPNWKSEAQARINATRKASITVGLKIRGHNMFWGVDGHVPAWLAGKSPAEYISEMKLHVHEVINHTRGTLEHWDVNNENQHGDYFERHTGDPDITAKMFQWIHSEEPNVKLFINEYHVITESQVTTATRNQAIQLRNMGIPVYAVGIQGHFKTSNIDYDVIKYRLDKVAEAGLKIWITEFTVSESDMNKKTAVLENLLTLFYSHPAVEGVMLWGIWGFPVHGPFTPNAAQQKYFELVHKDWQTSFTHAIDAHNKIQTSGFLGDYILNVKRNGHVIHQEEFSLDSAGKHLTVHLTGDQQVSHVAFG